MKIAVVGALGKMGQFITKIARERGHEVIQIDTGTTANQLHNALCDAVIDFSVPQALDTSMQIALQNNAPLICGTTGYNKQQLAKLDELSHRLPVVVKSNFSQSIDSFVSACATIAQSLPKCNIKIEEHHRANKKDKPSGTALTIQKAMEKYHSQPITIDSLRYGDTVGIHKVTFVLEQEKIEFIHTAHSRQTFALGAVLCAEKLINNKA